MYKKKCVMVLEPAVPEVDKEPLFGKVEDLFVIDSVHVYLYMTMFDTLEYNSHFCTFVVRPKNTHVMYPLNRCRLLAIEYLQITFFYW